jgi:hypothetical protein
MTSSKFRTIPNESVNVLNRLRRVALRMVLT